MALKAYKLSCECDEGFMRVLFAAKGKDLRGRRPHDFCGCEFVDLRVKRSPEFDQFAPGPITVQQYLDHGWWYYCAGCHVKQLWANENPIIIAEHPYCDRNCIQADIDRWKDSDHDKLHESILSLTGSLLAWLAENPENSVEESIR
jgi:hypothetical protein